MTVSEKSFLLLTWQTKIKYSVSNNNYSVNKNIHFNRAKYVLCTLLQKEVEVKVQVKAEVKVEVKVQVRVEVKARKN
ncbi:hypothetical protein DBT48_00215 [Aerococcus mictus]|uniref:Uncharacterized protein n=1 Tax=Aerococcus urinae TaxID=1376 RepID=A0A329PTK5_9LACT|nr:hypothetical protein [Aerococcus mictus]MDK7802468.1 hypothetical protein [Aerococcus urinae]RAV77524.1 hypothetical protein DBT54_08685 [Aerococcus loyolae]MCY3071810.1 hypothetical protein [Aerococcus mictus]RAV73676.1 hypothetical protein DBT47_01765 [Aerococcus mictus]RAV75616.1 hypothetical protein DBT48_00215 [Aerococcus mictus]